MCDQRQWLVGCSLNRTWGKGVAGRRDGGGRLPQTTTPPHYHYTPVDCTNYYYGVFPQLKSCSLSKLFLSCWSCHRPSLHSVSQMDRPFPLKGNCGEGAKPGDDEGA